MLAAALTPVGPDLRPNGAALCAHLAWLLANGCDGINLLGTTGEATSFSIEQRIAVMEGVAAAGLPLERFLVGTGTSALADTVRLTSRAIGLGFAGPLVLPPFYFKDVPEAGVVDFYAALIERVADPRLRLYLYHFPAMSAVPISPAVIEALCARYPGTIAGVKDSSGAPGYAEGLVRSFPQLDIFPSSESTLRDARRTGYAGCISATINLFAPLAARVWAAAPDDATGDRDANGLAELRATVARYPLIPAIRYVTAVLTRDDSWKTPVPPLTALAPSDGEALLRDLRVNPAFAAVEASYAARGRSGEATFTGRSAR